MPATRFSFGLVASEEAASRLDALGAWMKKEESLELVGRRAPTYKELAASVREGTSDIAWLPPVAYAWLAEAVTPIGCIVRAGKTTYASALVVRESSPFGKLEDLVNTRAGWVDPWSAAGYVVPRLELAKAGVKTAQAFASEKFYGGHREALTALANDECDVVGTYEGAWNGMEGLRALTKFGDMPIPTDVIAVRRNLGPKEYEAAVKAFRDACKDDAGRDLVRAVFDGDELRETLDPGHDVLRRSYERGIASGLFD